jgi:oligopeptidase A
VLDGLFALANRLFGVSVRAADGEMPVWDPSVRFFRIADESGRDRAAFYLDPFSRPANKRGGAWMDNAIDRKRRADGSVRLPVAYLVCNQTPPIGATPSLMTFREVETLFHEFGHGLQHMLTAVEHVDAAGINNVEWDAVELPSQFMENWCYHWPTVRALAKHYTTGEALPRELFDKVRAARTYRAGSATLRQVYFSTLDLELHHRYRPAGVPSAILELQRGVAAANTVLPPLPEDRMLCGFSHIFAGGYAAGYYSYKWAEVLSADAFSAFEEAGLDDPARVAATGRRFRDTVLALGGSKHPMEVFTAFRGRPPSTRPLLVQTGLA